MTRRGFLTLLVLTLISAALAGWALATRERPVASLQLDEPFLPQLAERLGEVAELVVRKGGTTITARRTEDGWVVVEAGDFPADPERIREIVLGLAAMRLVEAKTADPERFARLGLDPEASPEDARIVELRDAGGNVIARAILGKRKWSLYGPGKSGMYVRRPDENRTWLADRAVDLPDEPLNLVDRNLAFVPRDDIREVRLHVGTPEELVITRTAPKEPFTLAGLGPDEAADEAKLNRVVAAFGAMAAEEIARREEKPVPEDADRARYLLFDGTVIDVRVWKEGDGEDAAYWVAPEARFDPTLAAKPASSGAEKAPAPAKEEGDAGRGADAGAEEEKTDPATRAADWQRRYAHWVFRVSRFLGERLLWTRDDLLEKPAG